MERGRELEFDPLQNPGLPERVELIEHDAMFVRVTRISRQVSFLHDHLGGDRDRNGDQNAAEAHDA